MRFNVDPATLTLAATILSASLTAALSVYREGHVDWVIVLGSAVAAGLAAFAQAERAS